MCMISVLTLQDVSGIGRQAKNLDFIVFGIFQEVIGEMGAVPINNKEPVSITSQLASCRIEIL